MTKIDIFSGFLGAGKTTLIKKLVKEAYGKEKIVIIENEFGEIGIDGKFLSDAGIEITEMNSGCICCSLVGDFKEALKKVLDDFSPDRIIIEPSGVGKLSDVIKSVTGIGVSEIQLNCVTAVVDAQKCKMYTKNFGEFFNDQIKSAKSIVLSRTGKMNNEKINETVDIIKNLNNEALIITTDWEILDGKKILQAIETGFNAKDLMKDEECPVCHHHHDHDEHCHHEHHHDHDEHCHHEHHHHHADDVFTSWGKETAKKYNKEMIEKCLSEIENDEKYGTVLRAKGVVEGENEWIYFDYVPGEADVRNGEADVTGRLCVIGAKLNENALCELFEI